MNVADEGNRPMANIWWCNMLLLGFSPARNDKDHGLSFHPNMFDQTNTKGMQVVLFYLLCQINRQRTKKAFKHCWPSSDSKHLNDYKKVAQQLITELEQEGEIPVGTFRLSHLQTHGARFYNLLWHLSTAAVKAVLVKNSCAIPPKQVIDAQLYKQANLISTASKLHIARQRKRFVTHAQKAVAEKDELRKCAEDLEAEYRSLTQKMNKLKDEPKRLADVTNIAATIEQIARRERRIEQIKRVWDLFTSHYEESAASREMISSNLALDKSGKPSLDQSVLRDRVALLRQQILATRTSDKSSSAQPSADSAPCLADPEVQQLLTVDPLKEEKMDLLQLVKLWDLSLSVVKRQVESNHFLGGKGVTRLSDDVPLLTNILKAHQNHLSSLYAFNNNLHKELPSLQDATTKLRSLLTRPMAMTKNPLQPSVLKTPSRTITDASASFELVPPTPDVSFDKCFEDAQKESFQMPLQVPATPLTKREDQERMADSVHRVAKQRRPRLSVGSSRMPGGLSTAMRKAVLAGNMANTSCNGEGTSAEMRLSPLGMNDANPREESWLPPDMNRLELSPLHEMTAQFTLNLGLFSPLSGSSKPAIPTAASQLSYISYSPASPFTSSPASSPFQVPSIAGPFASSTAPSADIMSNIQFTHAFTKVEDDELWLAKDNSIIRDISTLSSDNPAFKTYPEDVLEAKPTGFDRSKDLTNERVLHSPGLASSIVNEPTFSIPHDEKTWQEKALADLSAALDHLDDDFDICLQEQQTPLFSGKFTNNESANTQGEEAIGEADFDALVDDVDSSLEHPRYEDFVEPQKDRGAPDDIKESVREDVRKRISLSLIDFEQQLVEGHTEKEQIILPLVLNQLCSEPTRCTQSLSCHVLDENKVEAQPDRAAPSEEETTDARTFAAVNWSMAIESDDDDDGDGDGDDESYCCVSEEDQEMADGRDDIFTGLEGPKENTAAQFGDLVLGEYSVLDLLDPNDDTDGGVTEDATLGLQDSDELFADLQEELGNQDEAETTITEDQHNDGVEERKGSCENDSLEEARSTEDPLERSCDVTPPDVVSVNGEASLGDHIFGLLDQDNEEADWDTFCSSPAAVTIVQPRDERKQSLDQQPKIGFPLFSTEQDETVIDCLLTPVVSNSHRNIDSLQRPNAVTPESAEGLSSPSRLRKKLSFSSISH